MATNLEELHQMIAGGTPAAMTKLSRMVTTLTVARKRVDTNPSEKQKEVGNYRKGHIRLMGLDITLEQPKGSTRRGVGENGKAWASKMHHDYGYVKKTKGNDGDHVDVFIGPNRKSEVVFVINQVYKGKLDEHKVMLGFDNETAARKGYLKNYQRGWQGLGSIHALTARQFKQWLRDGDQTKAVTRNTFAVKTSESAFLRGDEKFARMQQLADKLNLGAIPRRKVTGDSIVANGNQTSEPKRHRNF